MQRMKYFIPTFLCLLFIVSCTNWQTTEIVTTAVRPVFTNTISATVKGSPTTSATKEIVATNEYQNRLEPTVLPIVTNPPPTDTVIDTATATPTFDPANIVTVTPAPPAMCQSVGGDTAPFPEFLNSEYWSSVPESEIEREIIDYLNMYGPQPIVDALQVAIVREEYEEAFEYQDFTNDGSPDLLLATSFLYIFGCQDGEYQALYVQDDVTGYLWPFGLADITDGNRNGIPEITLITNWKSQGGREYEVYEWDETNFRNLLVPASPAYPNRAEISVEGNGSVYFEDVNGDFLKEIVAERGLPVWSTYYDGIPWRHEINYYKWDGLHYVFFKKEYDAPEYRFQAVQDGDRFSLEGNYELALARYQDAISSDQLEWWSPERQRNLQEVWAAVLGDNPTPTPVPVDPNEYDNLAAYSRYRIVLLYIIQGIGDEAEIVYNTLQEKYPKGQVGRQFAEIASAFWNEYQLTQDISNSCAAAIDYAKANSEILFYLGDWHHGEQGRKYEPKDVCPFQ